MSADTWLTVIFAILGLVGLLGIVIALFDKGLKPKD